MVSVGAMGGMVFQGLVSLLIPLVFMIYLRRKGELKVKPLITGLIVFILFSQVLEKGILVYVLQINPHTKAWLKPTWAFATYGALMAGIFEEVGRFLAFKTILKQNHERKDGLSYGLGHGGVEALLLGVVGTVQALLISIWLNAGTFDQMVAGKLPADVLDSLKHSLIDTPVYLYGLGGLERLIAFIIQIALSLFILSGIRKGKNGRLIVAILLHALLDFPAALYQAHVLPIVGVEGILIVYAIVAIIYIRKTANWSEREAKKTQIV